MIEKCKVLTNQITPKELKRLLMTSKETANETV